MPSPDLTPYVDLELFDREADELVDFGLLIAQERFPDWVPRFGNTEVVLLEAFSVVVAELIYAVNRIPGAVTSVLMRLFGSAPSEGVAPTTTLTFTVADTLGHTIAAGTRVRVQLGGSAEDMLFATDTGLVIPAGSTTGTVAATGDRPTDEANGLPAGTVGDMFTPVVAVDTVVLATDIIGGQGPESDAEWINRAVQRLQRLVTTLVRPEHFTAAALDEVDVARATTVDNYDPGQAGNPGSHPGHVTTAVIAADGVTLSATRKTAIEGVLNDQALANLGVHVIDPTITNVNVTVTVKRHATHTDAQVITNVTTILGEYLDPDTWMWSGTVRRNELIAIIDRAEGVDYVVDITAPAADVALAGVAPLARLGTVTVTVQS